jgi:hypothetical protein
MPPAPPVRPSALTPYRFHAYSYPGDLIAPAAWALSGGLPSAGGWQFYSMRRDLADLRALGVANGVPNIAVTPLIVGNPTGGARRTLMLSFGNLNNVAGRPTVVITGGVHAREWIGAEIAYLIAEYLIANYVAAPAAVTPRQGMLRNLVNRRNIRVIPMVNPDGNDYTVFTAGGAGRLWRKNRRALPVDRDAWVNALVPVPGGNPVPPLQNVSRWWGVLPWASYDVPDYDPPNGRGPGQAVNLRGHRLPNDEFGVDLNRNMGTHAWGYDARPGFTEWDPSGESFFGTAPGGEPETSNVQLAMPAAVDVAIDYHCYGGAILYPSEAFYAAGINADYTSTGQMLQSLIRTGPLGPQYNLGDPAHVPGLGYDATGSVADYAAQRGPARAVTIELDTAGQPGLGGGFLTQLAQIQTIFERNIRGALAAIAAPVGGVAPGLVTAQYAYANWPVAGHGNQVP